MKKIGFLAVVAVSLSGCYMVTPQTEETPINMVEFQNGQLVRVKEKGPNTIVCQDYWQHFTLWDRALSWPDGMTSEDATAVCRSNEQMATEAPTSQPWEPIYNSRTNRHDQSLTDAANASVGAKDVQAR